MVPINRVYFLEYWVRAYAWEDDYVQIQSLCSESAKLHCLFRSPRTRYQKITPQNIYI